MIKSSKKILIIFLVIVTICFLLGFFIKIYINKNSDEQVAIKVCDNLINAELVESKADCVLSQDPFDVWQKTFVINETDISFVRFAMMGFEETTYYLGEIESCGIGKKWEILEYQVSNPFPLPGGKLFEFSFCEGILVGTYWEN